MKQFYYDFDENEYYALIAVTIESHDLKTTPYEKATEIYANIVAGGTVEQVLEEGSPTLRTKEYAFMKFLKAPDFKNETVGKVIKEFEEMKNGVLLIDSSLI